MYRSVISKKADIDLINILDHTQRNNGKNQRIKYQKMLQSTFEKITKMPTIGHSRKDLPAIYLTYAAGQHSIIYFIEESKKLVIIIRILHSAMDFTRRF